MIGCPLHSISRITGGTLKFLFNLTFQLRIAYNLAAERSY